MTSGKRTEPPAVERDSLDRGDVLTRRRLLAGLSVAAGSAGIAFPASSEALAPQPHSLEDYPRTGGPRTFSLVVAATVSGGATVGTDLALSNYIGLVVGRALSPELAEVVGVVPLGPHHKGQVRVHWDLKVNGKLLSPGSYQVNLEIFTHDRRPSGIPPTPFYGFLTIAADGTITARTVPLKELL